MQRDDRRHRREAQLEAGAGDRFGPKNQHDQRAHRDQPQADRVSAKRNSSKHEQGGDAAAHGRHLRAGKQGVGDPGQRAEPGRNEDEVEPQRETFAQSEQPQRQEHRGADHRRDVQPADRQQMGKTAAPHRLGVFLADRSLVAGGQSGSDRSARSGQRGPDVTVERGPDGVQASPGGRLDHGQRSDRPPNPANAPKPGVAGEVVRSGESHRRRRLEPRAKLDRCARANPAGRSLRRTKRGPAVEAHRRQAPR